MAGHQVQVSVFGAPVPKGRPRLSTINGHARAFTPSKTRRYEDLIRLEAGRVMEGRDQLQGPLSASVEVYVAIPKSFQTKRKLAQIEEGQIRPTTKPDLDNYIKCIDSLNGIVFHDDAQIVSLVSSKHYSKTPRLVVHISELTLVEL
jgi:Holliday junction resolvase RusA-like endonuclease